MTKCNSNVKAIDQADQYTINMNRYNSTFSFNFGAKKLKDFDIYFTATKAHLIGSVTLSTFRYLGASVLRI